MLVVSLLVAVALAIWLGHRATLTLPFLAARRALASAARRHGSLSVSREGLSPTLAMTRGARVIEALPRSLGVLRDDPPYTWWWITTDTTVSGSFSLHVCLRSWHVRLPTTALLRQAVLTSGDDAFDARYSAYLYHPAPDRIADAQRVLDDIEVRRILAELLDQETDDVCIGRRLFVSRRRTGLTLDDALQQMGRTAALAEATERVFTQRPYR